MESVTQVKASTLTLDETYKLLSVSRRRGVITALLDLGDVADRSAVIDHVAETEAKPDGDSDADHRKRVYGDLHQNHFPALDEAEVIQYDCEEYLVSRGPNFDHLARVKTRTEQPGDVA